MALTAVAHENGAIGRGSDSGQAVQRLTLRLGEKVCAAARLDGGQAARGASKQTAVGVKGEAADITVELGEHGAIFVADAAQLPHLAAG